MTMKRLATIVLLVPAIWSFGFSQIAIASGAGGTSLNWTYRQTTLPSSGKIRILLPAGYGQEYVLGVRASGTGEPTFVVGEAVMQPRSAADRSRLVTYLDNVAPNLLRTYQETLELLGTATSGASLVIYGTVPEGSIVEFYVGTTLLNTAQLATGGSLLVSNGIVIPEPVHGMRSLLAVLTRPTLTVDKQTLHKLPSGRYFIPLGVMAQNLSTIIRPVVSPQADTCCDQICKLRVLIDMRGSVTTVEYVGGDATFLYSLIPTVRAWKFVPFVVNGAAVQGEGIIPFFISKNGSVQSPIFEQGVR